LGFQVATVLARRLWQVQVAGIVGPNRAIESEGRGQDRAAVLIALADALAGDSCRQRLSDDRLCESPTDDP